MALQTTTNINIDFYDKKYILINAKQFDRKSRFISVACYNHGVPYILNDGEHSAYIRYKKADNHSVFNPCEIDGKGNVIVELTEQMLAVDGICYADLVIVDKGGAKVDAQTGEIINIESSSILSTMPIHIDVTEIAVANSDIESSYEFNGLNTALEKAEAEYTEVILTSKSWAVGGTGIRSGEDVDNAKYYSIQSSSSASSSSLSALNASNSETNANEYMRNALTYSQNAQTYMNTSEAHMNSAKVSEQNAKASEDNSKASEINANTYMEDTRVSEEHAHNYATLAKRYAVGGTNSVSGEDYDNAKYYYEQSVDSANNAKNSENSAIESKNLAQSYAVGGTGTRGNEDYDNSHYYYELTKNIVVGLDSGFIPMGTVSFSELANVEKATGYVYNINNDFVTDESFREGAGKSYTAGVNVYYCANGKWDCFGGASQSIATLSEVKEYLGIE